MMTRSAGDILEVFSGLKSTMNTLFLENLKDNTRHGLMARHNDLVNKAYC